MNRIEPKLNGFSILHIPTNLYFAATMKIICTISPMGLGKGIVLRDIKDNRPDWSQSCGNSAGMRAT